MTQDERDAVYDQLPLTTMPIWTDDEELPPDPERFGLTYWMEEVLGHPKAHPGCCRTCGCCTTCMARAFFDATVNSVLRELDLLGLLKPVENGPMHNVWTGIGSPVPASPAV